jgi:hypothetical protein
MAKIHVPFFDGVIPKRSPLLLKDTEATGSVEARLDRGHLEGWNELGESSTVFKPSENTRSIYPYKAGWLFWDSRDVDVVHSPVLDDEFDRIYYTGDGLPKISYRGIVDVGKHDANGIRLGVPAPETAPWVELAGGGNRDPVEHMVRHYAYTFVNTDGTESALSRPTTGIQQEIGAETPIIFPEHPKINGSVDDETNWAIDPKVKRRLYRVGSDSSYAEQDDDFILPKAVYNSVQVDTRTITIAFPHGLALSMEHMVNATDVLSFTYNGTGYKATVGNSSAPSSLLTYLHSAPSDDDPEILFGSGLLSIEFETASDLKSTIATVQTKDTQATLSGVSYTANSFYWHVADVPFNDNSYNDTLSGSRAEDEYTGNGIAATAYMGALWTTTSGKAVKPLSSPTSGAVVYVGDDTAEDRSYVFTYANMMGEEGPPSNPSDVISVVNGEKVVISFADSPDSSYNLNGGVRSEQEVVYNRTVEPILPIPEVKWTFTMSADLAEGMHHTIAVDEYCGLSDVVTARAPVDSNAAYRLLYRTATGTTGVEFQLVATVDINTLSYEDTISTSLLGEILPSGGWFPPSNDLQGLVALPNGFLAGFAGQTLGFSEAYMPHAWPAGYELKFNEEIVGLGVSGNSIAVLTEGFPYLVTGGSPDDMMAVRVESAQSCSSKASIVDMGEFTLYASPDGLVSIGESGAEVLTSDILTREQWQAYGPTDIVGFLYEGYYVGSSIARGKSFIVSKDGTFSDLEGSIRAHHQSVEEDKLYVVDDGLRVFNEGGSKRKVVWKSKPFRFNSPTSLGALKILGEGSCSVRLWGDGNLLEISPKGNPTTELVLATQGGIVRLPGGKQYLTYEFELSTYGRVDSITLASSVGELSDG